MGRSLRALVALACLVGVVAPSVAVADTINPDREFLRADTNVVRWCATNFQNPRLTPFVGCDVGNAFAEQVGVATTEQVVFFQHVSGNIRVSRCGVTVCFHNSFWTGIRKVIVRLRPNKRGVLKRRVVRRRWRCTPGPGGAFPPSFKGIPCFAPHDPKTPV
jgi:hypothetical protein